MPPPPPPSIGRAPDPDREELLYVAAPFFMLAAPFAGFLAAADYPWTAAETLMSAAVLIVLSLAFGTLLANIPNFARAVALLALAAAAADFLWPLPELGAPLAAAAGAWGPWAVAGALAAAGALALVLLTVSGRASALLCAAGFAALGGYLVVAEEAARDRAAARFAAAPADPALPPLLHIVLGAHNGLAGLAGKNAEALRRDLANMWTGRGFRVFTHAYGQYGDLPNGLSALLNFDAPARGAAWLEAPRAGARGAPRLADSAWFRHLAGLGYGVHVFGDDRLDLCIGAAAGIARCAARSGGGAGALAALDAPSLGKFGLLWRFYLERSELYTGLRALYRAHAVPLAARLGLEAPAWGAGPGRLDSHAAAAGAAELAAEIAAGGGGRAWFAVLPLAEAPLAYGATCALIPEPDKWLGPRDPALAAPRRNDAAGRLARHDRLNGQIACAHSRLAALVDALDETAAEGPAATVFIHGLYGSGISEYEPSYEYEGVAGAADFVDGFSTFLAVRAPGVAAGADSRPTPLQAAFPAIQGQAPGGGPEIYLRARAGGALAPRAAEAALGPAFAREGEQAAPGALYDGRAAAAGGVTEERR